ncbi:hypothetical protein B6S44_21995 [Bosea sp. Tri-44]|uniref:TniQ family protein n=1 Tax=Bosea sp. Tri-44 TaxID=1972137 RepID=UPI00100DE241|nr:TniQ family protein [Bosea sp. Tri-44]RXT51277.1 hypothetical protein B6S44_21995 [Bosea sp. Tri-44]
MRLATLPVRPIRHSGEPAYAYCARIGATNGLKTLTDCGYVFGFRSFEIIQGKGLECVAELAGQDIAALSFDTAKTAPDSVELRGERLFRRQWSIASHCKVCPGCVRQDVATPEQFRRRFPRAWRRTFWDLRAIDVCLEHSARLIDACEACGEALSYENASVGRCPLGHDIARFICEAVPEGETLGARYIMGRLGFADRVASALLDDLELGRAITTMEAVGRAAMGIERFAEEASNASSGAILSAGFNAMQGLSERLPVILDGLVALSGQRPWRWGLLKAYGEFYEWVMDEPQSAVAHALRAGIVEHAQASDQVTFKANTNVAGVVMATSKYVPLAEAAAECGMGTERFRRFCEAQGVLPSARLRQGESARISRAFVDQFKDMVSECFNATELEIALGVSSAAARAIVDAGLVDPILPAEQRRELKFNIALFSVQSVRRLIDDLAARIELSGENLTALPKAAATVRFATSKAVELVLSGRLSIRGYDGSAPGLQAFLIDRSELSKAIGKQLSDEYVPITVAADQIGIKGETARALRDHNLLDTTRHRNSLLVRRDTLQKFVDDHVTSQSLAAKGGFGSASAATKQLKKVGLSPILPVELARQAIFRRSDAEAALDRWHRLESGAPRATEH